MGSWWEIGAFSACICEITSIPTALPHYSPCVAWKSTSFGNSAFLSLLMEVEGGNVLRKNLKQTFVTIAGYNVRGQILFTVKVISGCRKIFTNLFWLPQLIWKQEQIRQIISYFVILEMKSLFKRKGGFSVIQIVFVLSLRISKDEKNFTLNGKQKFSTEPKRNSASLLFSEGMTKRAGKWIISIGLGEYSAFVLPPCFAQESTRADLQRHCS